MITFCPIINASAAVNLVQIQAPADQRVRLVGANVALASSATPQQATLGFYRTTTLGTGGTLLSPGYADVDDPDWSGVARSLPSGAVLEAVPVWRKGALLSEGWVFNSDDETQILIPKSGGLILRLDTALTAADLAVSIDVELFG